MSEPAAAAVATNSITPHSPNRSADEAPPGITAHFGESDGTAPAVDEYHKDRAGLLASRIKEREASQTKAEHSSWRETGRDIDEASKIPGIKIGKWKESLPFSQSKADKLLRAFRVYGEPLKFVNVTNLPPPALIYKLAAAWVPKDIQKEFIDQILADNLAGACAKAESNLKSASKDRKKSQQNVEPSNNLIALLSERLDDDFGRAVELFGRIDGSVANFAKQLRAYVPSPASNEAADGTAPSRETAP